MSGVSSDAQGHSGIFKLTKPAPKEGITHCGPWLKHIDEIKGYPVFPEEYK